MSRTAESVVEVVVPTAERMRELGRRLAAVLRRGDLVLLTGDLGAGKTTLTQGIGAGLRVRGPVTSPTFVIARVHPAVEGRTPLVHVDAYRLNGWDEVEDLDLELTLDEAVTVVEWGAGLAEGLSDDRLEIAIYRSPESPAAGAAVGDEDARTLTVRAVGPRWTDVDLARVIGLVA
jgi:tRNA threonylcarbamoyladenosine biosynthesis protein TsaE